LGDTEENKPSDPATFELKKFVVSLDDIQQTEEGAVNIPPPMPDHPPTDYDAPLENNAERPNFTPYVHSRPPPSIAIYPSAVSEKKSLAKSRAPQLFLS
jgi:hypothetical protein